MNTVLITGGAGFIGSNLCHRLINDGFKVICVDNFITGNLSNIYDLMENPNFKLITQDIITPLTVDEKIDVIFNLACPASPVKYQKNPIHTIKTSTLGLINIIELAKKNNSKLIHASTSEIYGNPTQHPQKETYNGNVNTWNIRSCYDEGKRLSETLMFEYTRKYNLDTATVRIFNTYGPLMDKTDGRVVSNFINQALKNDDLTIYGDGTQTRSLIYITDLIEGLLTIMENITLFDSPINLGNPNELTINGLADMILELTQSNSLKKYFPLPIADPLKRKPDISLIKSKVNWSPKIKLKEGLEKTIEYYGGI